MDYSNRDILVVSVDGVQTGVDPSGNETVGAEVRFSLASLDNKHLPGASVTVSLAMPFERGAPIEELEQQILTAAHALLRRFADESPERLREIYARHRDERTRPDPLAELQKKWEKPPS